MNNEPTIFDELFAKIRPETLLGDPRATGEGISLAIIDSGIDASIIADRMQQNGHEYQPIEGAIFRNDVADLGPYLGKQSAPHGTIVADIILRLAPRVKIFSADVVGPGGMAEVETVVRAIYHAIEVWKCKIINLSLGVPEQKLHPIQKKHQIMRAIDEAYYRDVLIFAAAHNEHPIVHSYPAMFSPELISVDKAIFENEWQFAYELREHIEFQAYARGYLGPFSREPATSWATPHLAGIAAKILSLRPNLKLFEIKTILYWLFQSSKNGKKENQ